MSKKQKKCTVCALLCILSSNIVQQIKTTTVKLLPGDSVIVVDFSLSVLRCLPVRWKSGGLWLWWWRWWRWWWLTRVS